LVVLFDTNLLLELLPAPELNPPARQLPALELAPLPPVLSQLLKPDPSPSAFPPP